MGKREFMRSVLLKREHATAAKSTDGRNDQYFMKEMVKI